MEAYQKILSFNPRSFSAWRFISAYSLENLDIQLFQRSFARLKALDPNGDVSNLYESYFMLLKNKKSESQKKITKVKGKDILRKYPDSYYWFDKIQKLNGVNVK